MSTKEILEDSRRAFTCIQAHVKCTTRKEPIRLNKAQDKEKRTEDKATPASTQPSALTQGSLRCGNKGGGSGGRASARENGGSGRQKAEERKAEDLKRQQRSDKMKHSPPSADQMQAMHARAAASISLTSIEQNVIDTIASVQHMSASLVYPLDPCFSLVRPGRALVDDASLFKAHPYTTMPQLVWMLNLRRPSAREHTHAALDGPDLAIGDYETPAFQADIEPTWLPYISGPPQPTTTASFLRSSLPTNLQSSNPTTGLRCPCLASRRKSRTEPR